MRAAARRAREETVLRAALADLAEALGTPAPDALRTIRARIEKKRGAPVAPGTPLRPTADKEPRDMTSMQVQAHQLCPDDIITRHPDHPDRDIRYRVTTQRHVSHAQILVDYTCTSGSRPGVLSGVLILDVDQPCTIEPAHAHGGVR